ncbi:MAG: hypothetical protein PSX80_06260, partial [bacterium]|nr:hypothetical protein [bacterium]
GVRYFSISNDGNRVAYFKAVDDRGKTGLHVADTASGSQERLVYQPTAERKFAMEKASWSPLRNAVTIALVDDAVGADCDLFEIDADSGLETKLGTNLCTSAANFAWVKDGSGIALTGKLSDASTGRDASLAEAGSWKLKRLTAASTSFGQYSLSASEDGRLALLEGRNLPNISAIDMVNGKQTRLFEGTSRGEGAYGLASAPDGKVVFTVRVDDDLTIWEMAGNGSESRQLFPSQKGADDVQPNVTADNKYIVFESNRSGLPEIWRANRDGSDPIRLTSGGENSSPSVTPDGQFVLYSAKREGKYNIRRIPVGGGEPEIMTEGDCSWPDPSPDGKYFVCATGTATDWHRRRMMVYPINGGEPLKALSVAFNSALYNRIRWSPDSRSVLYKDEVEGLWKQSLEGGEPQRLPGFSDVRVFHLAFDNDDSLLFSGGLQMRQIVILEPPPK